MKRLVIGAALAAMLGSIAMPAAARDYGRYRDSDRDGISDRREWNRDRDRDGRPDQWDRYDNRRHHRHHRHHGRAYYRGYDGSRYGYYSEYHRPYRDTYRYRYYGW
jgi:hypothetical protein